MSFKPNRTATIILLSILFTVSTAQAYDPPVGIPAPPFGIDESHTMYAGQTYAAGGFTYRHAGNGPFTHYVDNTHPAATNVNNPYGTPDKPRKDLFDNAAVTLPAGSVVEIHGGPYDYSGLQTITARGTAAAPVFVRAVDPNKKVQIRGAKRNSFSGAGSYLIIENLEFYRGMAVYSGEKSNCIAVRFCEVHNDPAARLAGGAGMYARRHATNSVFYKNHIHHNNKANAEGRIEDCHGVNIASGASNVWVLENHIHHNSGDAFQASHRANISPHHVYIGRNVFHEDRENGVDLKNIHDVVVSQNVMYGYARSRTSLGDAVVIGSMGVSPTKGPHRSWILFNDIRDSRNGIRVEGARDCWIIGNTIHDTKANGVQFDIDSDSRNVNVINNTFASIGLNGIGHSRKGVGDGPYRVVGNILTGIGDSYVSLNAGIAERTEVTGNLFWASGESISVQLGETIHSAKTAGQINALANFSGNLVADPMLANIAEDSYHLQAGSPAIDAGTESPAYQAFADAFGLNIRLDISGTARPVGAGWDIGAYEWQATKDKKPPSPPAKP